MTTKINNVLQVKDPSGLIYYLGTITPAQIMELTFVPCVVNVNDDVLAIRTQQGYQREGDKKRMAQIKDFYSEHTSSLIPPVLLSTRGSWSFSPASKNGVFGVIEASDQAAIIDGQHRLGGLSMIAHDSEATSDALHRQIPFMAVEFDSVKVESDEFEVINGKQKGIKPSHLKYIRRDGSFIGNAANMLKEDSDSVFFNRIAIAERDDGHLITFKAATDLVSLTFDRQFCLNTFKPEASVELQQKAMQILLNYWRAVASAFPIMWDEVQLLPEYPNKRNPEKPGRSKFEYRLLEETGLRAFAMLGSNILLKSWMDQSQEISWPNVADYLNKVSQNETVQLVMQKMKSHNKNEILAVDPGLQFQGVAGQKTLYNILYGALEKK